ncbi:MAG: ABC transporter substrate-binding protein [Methanomassiliicoccus sp.]|nr:ABC transporter substrate-binding protein [Methanomassiliicoccus sp.]
MKRSYIIAAVLVVAVVVIAAVAWATIPSTSEKTIKYTTVAPKLQADAIAQGSIAGGISWEPYSSQAVMSGNAHVLYWSSEIWPDHPCCVVVASNAFAQAHPDVVKAFLKANDLANAWIADAIAHPDSANYTLLLQMGAEFSNTNNSVVADSLDHTKFTDQLSSSFIDGLKNFTNDFIQLNQTSEAKLTSAGYSSVDDFIGKYVDASYLNSIGDVQPTTTMTEVKVGYLAGDLHQFARLVAMNATVGGGTSLFHQYGINAVAASPGGFAAGPAEMDAFAANSVDIGYLGAPPAILKHLNNGVQVKIIAGANTEGSALVVSNDIKTFADLNGKVIGDPGLGSIQHLLLQAIAEKNGYNVVAA